MKCHILITTVILMLLLQSISCRKESITQSAATVTEQSDAVTLSACDKFKYADTIFYISRRPADYVVKPLINQPGSYGAFPKALAIDPLTGAINVSKSETGLRYLAWFKPYNSTDTCKKFITISGINYLDSIYVIKDKRALVKPVFNAIKNVTTTTAITAKHGHGEDEDENEFDDCPDTSLQLGAQGVAINTATGVIDLKQTLANGAFGANPVSGTFKDFVLNYRLSDSSNSALNRIALRLYYFKTKALIPASLKSELKIKQSQILFSNSPAPALKSAASALTQKGEREVKCRPPYIIVVGG